LNNTNVDFLSDTSLASKVANERSSECSNAVTVEKMEYFLLVFVVVDDTISITIEGAATIVWAGVGRRRG